MNLEKKRIIVTGYEYLQKKSSKQRQKIENYN